MMYACAPTTWAPTTMTLADPMRGVLGGYRPNYDPLADIDRSLSPHILKKHEDALKPLKELSKADPQFIESKDGNSFVLNLDLPGMEKDKVDVSVSGNMVSIKGAMSDEETFKTSDGGTSRSVSSSAVKRSYIAPSPILGAELKSKWDGSKLVLTVPKAPPGAICDAMGEGERELIPVSLDTTLLDAWDEMEQDMEDMLQSFSGGLFSSFGPKVKLTPEEHKSIEEHQAKEEEAKLKLIKANEERRAKEDEIRAKRLEVYRRRNLFTTLERVGGDLKLTVLFPEGTDSSMCSMAVEEDRFGSQYLLVDLKGPGSELVKKRKVPLSEQIDPRSISAKFDDKEGKLNIVLPQRKPKQISIDIMKD